MSVASPPPPSAVPAPRWIADPETLAAACRRWRAADAVAVDTEFVRERTFYAALGLVQIAAGDELALVDVVALDDLEPLAELFVDDAVTKVFHACGEDLEVLHHRLGVLPRPLFDTQIAAAFAGRGYANGYARLVREELGFDLPKGQTRSDWLKRPLDPLQIRYAALDVAYLLPLYRRLDDELERLGRRAWAREEVERLARVERFVPAPDETYRRIKGAGRLRGERLAILRELADWREHQARRLDLPRGFVIRDPALLAIAEKLPRDLRQLVRLEAVRPREARRHGEELLRVVAAARAAAARGELTPAESKRGPSLADHRRAIRELQQLVARTATELELPAELLASRKMVEKLARRVLAEKEPSLPRALRGWRRAAIGDRLAERARQLLT